MIYSVQSYTGTERKRLLPVQAVSRPDVCISQAGKCPELVPDKTKPRNGMWWIDRILIRLAVILFVMTVTAQLWIYLQQSKGGM